MMRPRLIVNADDLGLCAEVNAGILAAATRGIVTAAELLVNPPFEVEIQPFLAAGISLGLHLNLTLGQPCAPAAEVSSLLDADGHFLRQPEPLFAHWPGIEIIQELHAQLERFVTLVGRPPQHLSFHKHLHARDPRLLDLTAGLGLRLGIPVRALDATMRADLRERGVLTNDHFLGDVHPPPYWTLARLEEKLRVLSAGVTELMCHPGETMAPMPGVWYLAERQTELETLISAPARQLASGVDLVNFTQAFSCENP